MRRGVGRLVASVVGDGFAVIPVVSLKVVPEVWWWVGDG